MKKKEKQLPADDEIDKYLSYEPRDSELHDPLFFFLAYKIWLRKCCCQSRGIARCEALFVVRHCLDVCQPPVSGRVIVFNYTANSINSGRLV